MLNIQPFRDAKKHARATLPSYPTDWTPVDEFPNLSGVKSLAVDTETFDPELLQAGPGWGRKSGHMIGMSLATTDASWYFPIRHQIQPELNMNPDKLFMWLNDVLGTNATKIFANASYDLGWLSHEGVEVKGKSYDIIIAEKLLGTLPGYSYSLDAIASYYLGEGKVSDELYQWCARAYGGKPDGKQRANLYRTPVSLVGPYAEGDARLPFDIFKKQWKQLDQASLLQVYDIETRLIPLLVKMRMQGVRISTEKAEVAKIGLKQEIVNLQGELNQIAGFRVNSNSSHDLARLFKKANVDIEYTAKGNPSFQAAWLEAEVHPAAHKIRTIRKYKKIISTFIDGAILNKQVNGRVHGQFNQMGAITGRFSCVKGDTLIETKQGKKAIKDIKKGDLVWTHKNRWKPVLASYIKGKEQMYDITFSNGEILTCTQKHRLFIDNQWITIREILNGFQQETNKQFKDCTRSLRTVSRQKIVYDSRDFRAKQWYCNTTDNNQNTTNSSFKRRIQSLKSIKILTKQRRQQEPNEEQNWRISSQFQRRLLRWERWLYDSFTQWEEVTIPSSDLRRSSWNKRTSEGVTSSSYRWKQAKQFNRQSSSLYKDRSSNDSSFTEQRQSRIKIEKINTSNSYQVYDITVQDDESYMTCGVFSHNSSNPNLQNIPARDKKLGPMMRSIFLPEDGFDWIKMDYSSVEFRVFAHFIKDPILLNAYNNDPNTDFHKVVENIVGGGLPRVAYKTISFSQMFGGGVATITKQMHLNFSHVEQCRIIKSFGATVLSNPAEQLARLIMTRYNDRFPTVKDALNLAGEIAQSSGEMRTILNRRVHYKNYEPIRGKGHPIPYEEAVGRYGRSNIRRAKTYKALNVFTQGTSADIMKKAMVDAYEEGLFNPDKLGVPALTVHDELDFSAQKDLQNYFLELQQIMEQTIKLDVPLIVEADLGKDWGSVKSFDLDKWELK